uniref:Secreted protein n=1 Tax=Anguilla anguilla TaxID=7936 RepID=A0A0E9RRB6_ANGAN
MFTHGFVHAGLCTWCALTPVYLCGFPFSALHPAYSTLCFHNTSTLKQSSCTPFDLACRAKIESSVV